MRSASVGPPRFSAEAPTCTPPRQPAQQAEVEAEAGAAELVQRLPRQLDLRAGGQAVAQRLRHGQAQRQVAFVERAEHLVGLRRPCARSRPSPGSAG